MISQILMLWSAPLIYVKYLSSRVHSQALIDLIRTSTTMCADLERKGHPRQRKEIFASALILPTWHSKLLLDVVSANLMGTTLGPMRNITLLPLFSLLNLKLTIIPRR